MKYYLAYGSNLNVGQMRYRCPSATVYGTANLAGYELLYKGSRTGSYLTIEEKPGGIVPVAVWRVTKADEAALDRYEGYPAFYYKKDVIVRVGRRIITAFVYIMHEERPLGIPTAYYVNTCTIGYKTFGFNTKYLDEALRKSREAYFGEKVS